jgi:hypothetical protein
MIQDIMKQVASIESGINGIKQAFDEPPSAINNLPCFANFIGPSGTINRSTSRRETPHSVTMNLYITKKIIPEAEKDLRPFIDRTLDKFDSNISLNDTCQYSMITNYEPGVMEYNGQEYLGIAFTLIAVEHEIRSFSK